MTNMEAFLIQSGSYIGASRDEMIDEFGSVDGYIRMGLGLEDREMHKLHDELLD